MNDFERRLQEALRSVAETYVPDDEAAARRRFLRRRRRRTFVWTGAGVAVAGAAAAIALLVGPAPTPPSPDVVAAAVRPVLAATVDIGEAPVAVIYAEGAAWVTDRGHNTLSRIDPATNRVVARIVVADGPDDVIAAAGSIWVIHPERDVLTRVDPAASAVVDEFMIPGRGEHLDVARSEDALWLLEEGGTLHRFDLATGRFSRLEVADDATDITVVAGKVWVYARASGEVRQLDLSTGLPAGPAALVGRAGDADLTAGLGAIWFYGDADGKVIRIDRDTGAIKEEIVLGGAYAGLAVGRGAVWAMVGDGSGGGALYQIDDTTVTRVGAPVPLAGRPFDVDVGGDAVWVTNNSAGTVTRLNLVPAGTDDPDDPDPAPSAVPIADVVLYVSDGRDVLAIMRDGTERRVAATAAPELAPAVAPDGGSLVIQRGSWRPDDPTVELPQLIHVDLATGREREIGLGTTPAFAPDGRVAWLVPADTGARTVIAVASIDGDIEAPSEVVVTGPTAIANLAWSRDGRHLTFDSPNEGRAYRLDPSGPGNSPELVGTDDLYDEAGLVSPVDEEEGIYVLRVCCASGPEESYETLELGWVGDAGFTRVKGIDDFGLLPNSPDLSLAPGASLDYEADDGWNRYDERSWFISDGRTLLLVDERGEADRIPISASYGMAVNPILGE